MDEIFSVLLFAVAGGAVLWFVVARATRADSVVNRLDEIIKRLDALDRREED